MSHNTASVDPSPLGNRLDFNFSGRWARNRFLKAAMSERLSTWSEDDLSARGIPSDELVKAYRVWGKGDIGMILTGNVMIDTQQLETEGNLIIPGDAPFSGQRFEQFKKLADGSRAHGSLLVAQVFNQDQMYRYYGTTVLTLLEGLPPWATDTLPSSAQSY